MSKRQKTAPTPKLDKTFVYVSCKAPTGLLAEIGAKGTPEYRKVLIKGANEGTFNPRDGRFTATTVGGFGLTQIEYAFWKDWSAANAAFVREWEGKKLLAVHDSKDEADAWRLDNAEAVTGFEAIDPNKMPRGLEPAPTGAAV